MNTHRGKGLVITIKTVSNDKIYCILLLVLVPGFVANEIVINWLIKQGESFLISVSIYLKRMKKVMKPKMQAMWY